MLDAAAIVAAIDDAYDRDLQQAPRNYLGASQIGHPCDAALAFALRAFPEDGFPANVKRIFRLGHHLEDEVVRDLKRAGLNIIERDAMTGRQFSMERHGGFVKAHMDGQVVEGDEVSGLEIKSMNSSSWNAFRADGVRRSHPKYYDQMQMMCGMGGFRRFLFVAVNKDNSKYWAEFVDFDEFHWSFIMDRIERVLAGDVAKIAKAPDDWRCKQCSRRSVCWLDAPVDKNCSKCTHAVAESSGKWWCRHHDREANSPCEDWQQWTPSPRI